MSENIKIEAHLSKIVSQIIYINVSFAMKKNIIYYNK